VVGAATVFAGVVLVEVLAQLASEVLGARDCAGVELHDEGTAIKDEDLVLALGFVRGDEAPSHGVYSVRKNFAAYGVRVRKLRTTRAVCVWTISCMCNYVRQFQVKLIQTLVGTS
jgi:hypothetical protein